MTAGDEDYTARFDGIARLYGREGAARIRDMHLCVVGLGGVGSWAVEALARSGVGRLTLVDYDTVEAGNMNRQVLALTDTIDRKKVEVMAERVAAINPGCVVERVDDFVNDENLSVLLSKRHDYVIDAIDSIRYKAALIHHCKRNKIRIITTGGAGGLTDPSCVQVADLSRTWNDPLAAKVRNRLRDRHHFTRNPKRRFAVECVFSTQQQVYPKDDGSVSPQKPGIHGVSLDCRFGYGAAAAVTAVFGFVAAARAIEKHLISKR